MFFEVDEMTPERPQNLLGFRKCCARLHDDLFLYYDMTESGDLDKITGEKESNCHFLAYERQRVRHLKIRINNFLSEHKRALLSS